MLTILYLLGVAGAVLTTILFDWMAGYSIESLFLLFIIPVCAIGIGYLSVWPLCLGARKAGFNVYKKRWLELFFHTVLCYALMLTAHFFTRGGPGSGIGFFDYVLLLLRFPLEGDPTSIDLAFNWFDPVYHAGVTMLGFYLGAWVRLFLTSENADYYCEACGKYADRMDVERLFWLRKAVGQGSFERTPEQFVENIRWVTVPSEIEGGFYCGYAKPYVCPGCGERKMRIRLLLKMKKSLTQQATYFFDYAPFAEVFLRHDPHLDRDIGPKAKPKTDLEESD